MTSEMSPSAFKTKLESNPRVQSHVYPHTVYKHSTQWLLPHLVQRCRRASLQSREAWVRWVGSPPLRTSYCSLCGFPRVGASECHTEKSEENPYLTNDLTRSKTTHLILKQYETWKDIQRHKIYYWNSEKLKHEKSSNKKSCKWSNCIINPILKIKYCTK